MTKRLAGTLLAVLITTACTTDGPSARPSPPSSGAPDTKLTVQEVAGGLENGWDLGFLPDGKVLVTERPGRLKLLSSAKPGARVSDVRADLEDVHPIGEGGLLGLVIHPDFERSRQFTTCQTHAEGDRLVDVRMITWKLAEDGSRADEVRKLVTGMPVNAYGRHSGCRPTLAEDGALLVGTGDSAAASIAQDRRSLGGKVLRMDLKTGEGLPDNPFADSKDPNERRVASYGHRNVQGVALQPGTGEVYTAEHGPDVDDEVNRLKLGGNYGWDPSQGGTVDSYDESVPMTDLERFPDAVVPVWTTGDHTEAVCGAAFLTGDQWGPLEGALAITALAGQKLLLLTLGEDGTATEVAVVPELDGTHGRLRAARTGPDGALYITTSNGAGDKLLRITPAS